MLQLDSTTILLLIIAFALGYLIYQGRQNKKKTTTSSVTIIRPRRNNRFVYGRRRYHWGYPYFGSGYQRRFY